MTPKKRKVPIVTRGGLTTILLQDDGSSRITHQESEYTFAFELRNSARLMANLAKTTEDGPSTHWQLKAFIHGAVILSYAALEAALNEIIHLHSLTKASPLDEAERKVMYSIGQEGLVPRGESNTLQQFNFLLRVLDKSQLKVGDSHYQQANLVRMLRNMIIHPKPGRVTTFVDPENFDDSSQQEIVKKLRGALGLKKTATFPADIITKKCAIWAVDSCENFLHAFVVASGIDIGFLTDRDKPQKST
jgi:hypothetical protein